MRSPCSVFSYDRNRSLRMFGKSAADSSLLLPAFDTSDTQVSHFFFYLFLLNQRFLALHPPTFHCRWSEAQSHHLHLQAHQLVSVLIKESYLSLRAHQSSPALCEAAVIHPSPASLLRGRQRCRGGQGGCRASTPRGTGRLRLAKGSSAVARTSAFLPFVLSFFGALGPLGMSFFLLQP